MNTGVKVEVATVNVGTDARRHQPWMNRRGILGLTPESDLSHLPRFCFRDLPRPATPRKVTRFPQNTAAITDTTYLLQHPLSSFLIPLRPHRLDRLHTLPNILAFNVPDMQSWKNFSANLPSVDVSAVSKNLRNTVQATRWVGDSTRVTLACAQLMYTLGRDLGTSGLTGSPSASSLQPNISQSELAADDTSQPPSCHSLRFHMDSHYALLTLIPSHACLFPRTQSAFCRPSRSLSLSLLS